MKKNKLKIFIGVLILLIVTSIPVIFFMNQNGKKQYDVVYFGDSIIAGQHLGNDIPDLVESITGMKVLNAAFGGTAMSDTNIDHYFTDKTVFTSMIGLSEAVRDNDFSLVYTASKRTTDYEIDYWESVAYSLSEVDWKSVKYIIVEHGVNDYLAGIPVSDYENAIENVVENLRKGAPQATIIFTTPIYCFPLGFAGDCNTVDLGGGHLEDYVKAQIRTAEKCGVYSIDNYKDIDVNIDNYEIMLADGLHPNDTCKQLIAENVSEYLREYEGY